MHKGMFNSGIVVLGSIFVLLTGCIGPSKTAPTRFYVLNSVYSTGARPAPVADLKGVAIGVGPVRIPGKLDRPQIVTRLDGNEIRLNDFTSWGDPLGASLARALAENLSLLLNTENIAIFPWLQATRTDYQVTMDVTEFIGAPGEDVLLRAYWTLFADNGRTELSKHYTRLTEPAAGDDIAAMVQAQSRIVVALSRQIARAINDLAAMRPRQADN